MSGRGTGNRGLGRFIRKFDENETIPFFLRILPKKYHKEFQSIGIQENIVHKFINDVYEGGDVREELEHYLDIPPRFRFVGIKENKSLYDKLCKEYQNKTNQQTKQKTIVEQKQVQNKEPIKQKTIVKQKETTQQKQKVKQIQLKCLCKSIL